MRRIRIISDLGNVLLSRDELHAAAAKFHQTASSRRLHPSVQGKSCYLIGMPLFGLIQYNGKRPAVLPVNQVHVGHAILKNTKNKKMMVESLKAEYRAMIKALLALGVDFRVLNLTEGERDVGGWLQGMGIAELRLPADHPSRWLIYPRDLFVYLEAVETLLVHSRLFEICSDSETNCDIILSQWAEGGRVLFSRDIMLIGCHPEAMGRLKDRKTLERLREKGMQIVNLPYALSSRLSRENGTTLSVYYETHLDRSGSLLEGKDGNFHLILDPGFRTGKLNDPLSVHKSIELVRRACERIQVQVHVPKGLSIPYGTSMVQFKDHKVLATSGDDEILTCLSDIVGSENLHVTDVAITTYPVFACAGLHCLITEDPAPLIHTIADYKILES